MGFAAGSASLALPFPWPPVSICTAYADALRKNPLRCCNMRCWPMSQTGQSLRIRTALKPAFVRCQSRSDQRTAANRTHIHDTRVPVEEASTASKADIASVFRKRMRPLTEAAYFYCVEMLLNLALKLMPSLFTTVMMATDMPAAIRPYSIAMTSD